MLTQDSANTNECAVSLLTHYSFDLSGYTAKELVCQWLIDYPADWINLAVIEALYRGRYKAISVKQILASWQRRGIAIYHFNYEFERLICGDNITLKLKRKPDTQAKFLPPAPKTTVRANNGLDGSEVVKAEAGASEKRQAPFVDGEHKVMPSTSNSDTQLTQSQSYQTSKEPPPARSPSNDSQSSIKQFNPAKTDTSDFYSKLKAIVRSDPYTLAEGEAKERE